VTLNVALARSAFCGFCEVVFREWTGIVVVTCGALSLSRTLDRKNRS